MYLSRGYKRIFYLYYFDQETCKRRKISTKTRIQNEAIRFLENFKKTYLARSTQYSAKTVSELLQTILQNFRNSHSPKTLESYRLAFNSLIRTIGDKQLRLLTFADFELYKNKLADKLSKNSVNMYLRNLKAGLNYGLRLGVIADNPCKYVKQFTITDKPRLSFNEEELKKLFSMIDDEFMKHFVQFALLTGFRIGESLNVRNEDINWEKGIIYIRNRDDFTTKNKKERCVPLTVELTMLFKNMETKNKTNIYELKNPSDYLFKNNKGGKCDKGKISKKFKQFIIKAGLNPRFHQHSLRHSFITNLCKQNVSLFLIKEWCGHADISTTQRYMHATIDDLKRVASDIKYEIGE